jgi:hypothetical protein
MQNTRDDDCNNNTNNGMKIKLIVISLLKHHHYHCHQVSKLIFAEVDPFLLARIKGLHGGVPKDTFFDAALI